MAYFLPTLDTSPTNEILSLEGKLLRGKYTGWDAAQVVLQHPDYVRYILKTWDILDEDREVLETLMAYHQGT